ncbi:Serine/threonine-protein kinase PK-1 [Enhygromyxa salina]|uniref:Serine/threonine-protein kinase PK-1 n=1 Tax=Enhygromyxa salina TaxID=215803 RepID=A0A2S9YCV7_9BACT|nr:protein kinase [Enhygromyxa salina]PRQ02958.1 Serine/threonine-protein kinase PK-1 [Enhygromyxa salina]
MIELAEQTMPEQIADLDIEVQAMYDRVRTRLGLQPERREQIGRYELRGPKIGFGGMGSVYRAFDTQLQRDVAIKLVSPRSLTRVDKLRARLRREAIVLAKLDHPNIVTVFDSGVDNGRVFLAMELVDGQTLRGRQSRPDCSMRDRLRLYIDAGRGLAAAHRQGIVHRDFKPDNVFVGEDDRARVGDFGLAHVLGEHDIELAEGSANALGSAERMTQTGEFLGTLGYSAPEQLRGDRPDARSDQYAFCVALWESLCGEKPYSGTTRDELLDAIQGAEPHQAARLPSRLRHALRVGLSAQPQRRHRHMEAVVELLERELNRPERMLRRTGWVAAALISLAGLASLWFAYQTTSPDCPLADELAATTATEQWAVFHEAHPSLAARFAVHVDKLEADARALCLAEDPARRQQLQALLRSLNRLSDYEPSRFPEFAREFEAALVAGPTRALSPEVEELVASTLEPLDIQAAHEQVIAASDEALAGVAETPVDRAELRLRRGRAYSVSAEYDLAVADFKQARRLAEISHDQERRLQANIESAKTLVMRSEELERGDVWIDNARAILAGSDELLLSPRRSALDEVEASFARREGDLELALSLQRRSVLRDILGGRTFDVVQRVVNLGNIYEQLGRPRAAENCHRAALTLEPEDPEALVNLGRLLVNETELLADPDEARRLLTKVLQSDRRDAHIAAAVSALQLEFQLDESVELERARRAELVELLAVGHPGTPTHVREGWVLVVYSYAATGDFGPDFDAALEVSLPLLSAEQQAELALNLATLASSTRPDIAARALAAAQSRLRDQAPSPARDQLLSDLQDAELELEPPATP